MSGTRSHGGLTPLEEISPTGKWSSTPLLPGTSDPLSGHCGFVSELVASTDDEDFAVLLADVESLPDEVLETLAAVLQSCAAGVDRRDPMNLDRHARDRLGHYIVSRRVALGYRNRTDLADSLQFTVCTLADIEHGVRKAGTYAVLESKLAWARGSIDTILAGGEPNELVSTLHRGNLTTPSQGYALRPTP